MRILLFILVLALPMKLYAFVDIENGNTLIGSESVSISLQGGDAYLSLGSLSYGDISREGIVMSIANPYRHGFSLLPRALRPRRTGSVSGWVLDAGPLGIMASFDKRFLFSFTYSHEYFDAALLYAHGGSNEKSFHENWMGSGRYETMYTVIDARWKFLCGYAIASFSPELGYKGMFSIRLKHEAYSLSFLYGSPIALFDDDEERTWGVSWSFGEDFFYSDLAISFGEAPVFSDDYLPYSSEVYSVIESGDVSVFSHLEHSFTKRGRSYNSYEFGFSWDRVSLGYGSDGLYFMLKLPYLTLGYRNGSPFVAFSISFGFENGRSRVSFSTDGELDYIISLAEITED